MGSSPKTSTDEHVSRESFWCYVTLLHINLPCAYCYLFCSAGLVLASLELTPLASIGTQAMHLPSADVLIPAVQVSPPVVASLARERPMIGVQRAPTTGTEQSRPAAVAAQAALPPMEVVSSMSERLERGAPRVPAMGVAQPVTPSSPRVEAEVIRAREIILAGDLR